jgi:tRNA pseudouridine(55) synthase
LPGKAREGIGHTGTLDPFAEGLLLVGTEEATKLLSPLGGLDKTYEATALLGLTSDTLDPEGAPRAPERPLAARLRELERQGAWDAYLASKVGVFEQVPPAYSAIQVDGQRAYDLARKGQAVELKARSARILAARSLGVDIGEFRGHPVLRWRFEVRVSAGTYIRCLARDWGEELTGFPGMLEKLLRTGVGPYRAESLPGGHRKLGLADLGALFEPIRASQAEKDALRKGGLWKARPAENRGLVLGPQDEILAWTEAGSGKLGRVFTADPLL